MQVPRMTVGRAVGHYVEALNPLEENIAAYYDSLPFPDKPELESCRIHFSALAPHLEGVYQQSVWLQRPYVSNELDPADKDRGPSDIMLFVGSFARNGSFNEMDVTLRSQLANFARRHSPDPWLREEVEALAHTAESLKGGSFEDKAVEIALSTVALAEAYNIGDRLTGVTPAPEALWAAAIAASATIQLILAAKRLSEGSRVGIRLAREQRNRAAKLSTDQYGDTDIPLIEVAAAKKSPKPLAWSLDSGVRPGKRINRRHRVLSESPQAGA